MHIFSQGKINKILDQEVSYLFKKVQSRVTGTWYLLQWTYILRHCCLPAVGASEVFCVSFKLLQAHTFPLPLVWERIHCSSVLPHPPPPSIYPHLHYRGQPEMYAAIWLRNTNYVNILIKCSDWICEQVVFYHLGTRTVGRKIKGAEENGTREL